MFRFDGASWELDYHGKQVHLPDAKGLRDIARLLAAAGRPVHVLRLLGVDEPGGADPQLDERARQSYRARLRELDAEIEQAAPSPAPTPPLGRASSSSPSWRRSPSWNVT